VLLKQEEVMTQYYVTSSGFRSALGLSKNEDQES